MSELVRAADLPDWGGCFRKRTGTTAYLRVSVSSAKYLKLDPDFVYGVCYNGNVAKVHKETLVVPLLLSAIAANVAEEAEWEKEIGVVQASP